MRKWVIGCAVVVLLCFPDVVFAKYENAICVDGSLYDNVFKGSKVNETEVTTEQIQNKSTLPADYFTMKSQFGVNSPEFQAKYAGINENDYAISATEVGIRCNRVVEGNKVTWESCPMVEQYMGEDAPFSMKKLQGSVSEFQFNEAAGTFYLDIRDDFSSKLLVRVIRNGKENEGKYDYASAVLQGTIGAGEVYELNSSGLRLTFQREEDVHLEFYLKENADKTCGGAYIGDLSSAAPSYAQVNNPWKNSQICASFKNGYSHIPTNPTNFKALLVPECYQDKIDYFTERPNISEASIASKIEETSKVFSGTSTADISQLQCHYHTDGSRETATQTKTFIYNPSGSSSSSSSTTVGDYWAAACTETVTVNYDQPKQLIAGTGFSYDAILTVTRKCTPVAIRKILPPTECKYKVECWGGPAHHTGQGGAGPNEDFDECVNTCDGGKYSQECINACYSKVYEGKDIDIQGLAKGVSRSFLETTKARYMATDICATKTPTSPNYCYTKNGWKTSDGTTALGSIIYEEASRSNNESNCNGRNKCTTFHGKNFTYLNKCNDADNPTLCYEVYKSQPRPYCSDNPNEDLRAMVEAVNTEYEELLAAIRKYETTENFEMSVIDSYKTSGGRPLVTTSTSLENKVKVEGGVYTYPDTKRTYRETPNVSNQVYSSAGDYKTVPEVEVRKEYTINLPRAVINQITGIEKYVTNDYKKSQNERDGGNKYYTDINSGTYNDFRKWYNNYSPLDERADAKFVGNNIGVVFKNIGTVQNSSGKNGATSYTWDKIDLDCFYGLLNKRYIECDDGICDNGELVCDDGDVCTGGLQYMFRQINLTDMFPDRDPRWNWRYQSSMDAYGYQSNPKEVIADIETLGDGVYSSQNLDYEITITKENIRSIRRYNKSQGNYQNYNMSCTSKGNGMEVCESTMLKNTGYVKSYQRNTELGSND